MSDVEAPPAMPVVATPPPPAAAAAAAGETDAANQRGKRKVAKPERFLSPPAAKRCVPLFALHSSPSQLFISLLVTTHFLFYPSMPASARSYHKTRSLNNSSPAYIYSYS